MRLLGRLLVLVPLGLVFAVPVGAVALAAIAAADPVFGSFAGGAVWTGFWSLIDSLDAVDDPGPVVADAFMDFGRLAATLIVAPPLFIALAGEVAGFRSFAWYAAGTGAATAAVPWLARAAHHPASAAEIYVTLALFVVGSAAGSIYWLVAGRSAGRMPARAAAIGNTNGAVRT